MTVKYSPLPSEEVPDSTTIDFGSYFTYDSPKHAKHHPNYFSYATSNKGKYKSAFTYSKMELDPYLRPIEEVPEPNFLLKACATLITLMCYVIVFLTFPISCLVALKNIKKTERYVVFRLGKLLTTKGPGRVIILPCIDSWTAVDVTTRAFSVPPILVMLPDTAAIEIGADVLYHISDPERSVAGIRDLNHSLRVLSQTSLHNHLNKNTLSEIESNRSFISQNLKEELNKNINDWGVQIVRVELSQVKVLQESNPMQMTGGVNPMNILSQMLMGGPSQGGPSVMMPPIPGQLVPPMGKVGEAASPNTTVATLPIDQAHAVTPSEAGIIEVISPRQLMEKVRPHLTHSLVADIGARFKFVVSGENGGIFYLDLKTGEGSVGEGEPPGGDTDVTLTLGESDLQALFAGQMSAFNAYMGGRLKIDGDLRSAMALQDLIAKLRQ